MPPQSSEAPKVVLASRLPPGVAARVDRTERWRTGSRWGDLQAPTLTSVLAKAGKGEVAEWADLVEYAITSDTSMTSLYTTRLSRVSQADYEIVPGQFGNPELAKRACDFITEQMARIENWDAAFHAMLHAIAVGYSASEMVWAQDSKLTNYVQRIEFRHPHRFRYGPQWTLRLNDRGTRPGADQYGEILDPASWIVHEHQEVAGYQGVGGVMRSCIWTWMFCRWVDKFHIGNIEKHGSPLVHGIVPKDTKETVRTAMLESLENLSADHVAVFEEGSSIVVNAAAQAGGSDKHETYLRLAREGLAKAWLGSSDISEPGKNGSNAAVSTRAGATADPRMINDGKLAATSIRGSLFKQLIKFNVAKVVSGVKSADADSVPLPIMRMKAAYDEVKVDAGAAQDEANSKPYEIRSPAPVVDVAAIVRESMTAAAEGRKAMAGAAEDRKAMACAMVALAEAVASLRSDAPPKRKRPKAPAAGEPRLAASECCEPSIEITVAPKRLRTSSPSQAILGALHPRAK